MKNIDNEQVKQVELQQKNDQIKQQQVKNKKSNHSEHNHDQLDSDCQGCQKQKRQNQKLVDFYQRLDKISNKVKKVKYPQKFNQTKDKQNKEDQANNDLTKEQTKQTNQRQNVTHQILQQKMKSLDQRLKQTQLPSVKQIQQYNSKQIGFQLAAALIQREVKYKNQNIKLQAKINELLAQKKNQQAKNQSNFVFSTQSWMRKQRHVQEATQSKQTKDSLDELTKISQQTQDHLRKKNQSSYWQMEAFSTSFTKNQTAFFQTKNPPQKQKPLSNRTSIIYQNQEDQTYRQQKVNINKNTSHTDKGYGLNLWLYQFKTEEYQAQLMNSWISDQASQNTKAKSNRKMQANQRHANVNRTQIIQKNILGKDQFISSNPTKKKRY